MPLAPKLFITHCFLLCTSLFVGVFYSVIQELQSERADNWVFGTFFALLLGLIPWIFYVIWGIW